MRLNDLFLFVYDLDEVNVLIRCVFFVLFTKRGEEEENDDEDKDEERDEDEDDDDDDEQDTNDSDDIDGI